jgi:uncharacterized membrane protein
VKREFTMPSTLTYVALAAAISVAGPALAQSTSTTKEAAPQTAAPPASTTSPSSATTQVNPTMPAAPPSSAPSSAASGAATPSGTDAAASAGASTALMSGMSVKDNTGALIGEVKSIKSGVATIQMGADTFTVDADKLGVAGGAASINASQAELKKMLPKK